MLAVSFVEALLVHAEASLFGHLKRHLEREAKRIVELERRLAANLRLAMGLELLGHLVEHGLALVERLVEAVLLSLEIGLALREVLLELGIDVGVLLADRLGELDSKALRDAKEAAVSDRTADETAQNVVCAHVAGLHTALRIAEEERGRPHVVGDNAARFKRKLSIVRCDGGEFIDLRHDRREDLGVIDGGGSRHHADRALDTHAGIHIVAPERLEHAVGVLVVLHEDIIPDLDVLAAVAAGAAVRAALLLAGVDEHFGIGTAGAGGAGRAPPVVLAREAVDALLGNAKRLPDFDSLFVRGDVAALALYALALEHGNGKLLRREAELGGEKLKAPGDGLLLEIVVERPVAEHLEERKVRGVAHGIDVARADALLHIRKARSRRVLHRAHEIRHQRMHAGRGKENGRIVFGNYGSSRDYLVTLGLEKLKIHFAEFVRSKILHIFFPSIIHIFYQKSDVFRKPSRTRNVHRRFQSPWRNTVSRLDTSGLGALDTRQAHA